MRRKGNKRVKKRKRRKRERGGGLITGVALDATDQLKKIIIFSRIRGLEEKDSTSSMSLDFKGLTK